MSHLLHTMLFIYPLIKSFFEKEKNNGPRLQEYIVGGQSSYFCIPINTTIYKGNEMNNNYHITDKEYDLVVSYRKDKYKYVISELSNVIDVFNTDGIHFNIKISENDFILYTINEEIFLYNEIVKQKKTYLKYNRHIFTLDENYEINEHETFGFTIFNLVMIFEIIYNDLKLKKEIKEELDKVENNKLIKKKVKI